MIKKNKNVVAFILVATNSLEPSSERLDATYWAQLNTQWWQKLGPSGKKARLHTCARDLSIVHGQEIM